MAIGASLVAGKPCGVLRRPRSGHAERRRRARRAATGRTRGAGDDRRDPHGRAAAGSGVLHELADQHADPRRSSPSMPSCSTIGDPAAQQVQAAIDAVVSGRPRPVSHRGAGRPLAAPADPVLADPSPATARRSTLTPSTVPPALLAAPQRPLIVVGGGAQDAGDAVGSPGRAAAGAGDDAPDGARRDPDRTPDVRAPRGRSRTVDDGRRRRRHRQSRWNGRSCTGEPTPT